MNEALLAALTRRFTAVAEALPRVLPAVESADPAPFLLRYRRDLLAGIPDETFRRLRAAARDERETERRRRAARKAQDAAGLLTEELAKRIDESRDAAWLEDLARPAHKGRAEPEDPMTPVARDVLAATAPAATPTTEPTTEPAIEAAIEATSAPTIEPTSAPAAEPAAEPTTAPTADAPVPPASDGGKTLDELLAPFCGADGAHPTAVDQRARLVRLVAGLLGEDPELRLAVRRSARAHGAVHVDVAPAHAGAADWKPFRDFRAPANEVPARKLLLLRRGQRMGALRVRMELPDEHRADLLSGPLAPREGHPHAQLVAEAAKDALDRVLLPAAASEILRERRRQAERSMLPRMVDELRERLFAPPAGAVPVVAAVPGATGTVRLVAVDASGRSTATVALHPFVSKEPKPEEEEAAAAALREMVATSGAMLVAVGGSRRARLVREWVAKVLAAAGTAGDAPVRPVAVNEVAAAKWAESDAAKAEAGDLAASARVGLSLARSLQDPLAEAARWDLTEMVLDPNQRDLDQGELRRALDEAAADCVARVGVDANTAHAALLARVPGLDEALAKSIVETRAKNGPFAARADLRRVEGMTEEAWQRAGGFLRVRGGTEPIDATGVHPTGLPVVAAIAARRELEPAALVGAAALLEGLDPAEFATEAHTAADVASVIDELRLGSADPRHRFVAPAFNPGVERLRDVQAGMELSGVVTGLSKFGAFVDVGVRQSGLVHVSEMTHGFVEDPAQVVQPGQSVRVKVLAVDPAKRRIALSMKALVPAPERPPREERPRPDRSAAPAGAGRPPRREGAGPPQGSPPGARPGMRSDRPREDRPRAPLGPERPGTAPRRAGRGRGRGDDRRDGGGVFGRGRRDDRHGGRHEAEEEVAAGPPKPRGPQRDLDPFRLQLTALSTQLGLKAAAPAPAADAPTSAEPALSGKERRAMRRAQAKAAAPPPPAAAGDAASPDSAPPPQTAAAVEAESPQPAPPPEPTPEEPAPPAERPTEG